MTIEQVRQLIEKNKEWGKTGSGRALLISANGPAHIAPLEALLQLVEEQDARIKALEDVINDTQTLD